MPVARITIPTRLLVAVCSALLWWPVMAQAAEHPLFTHMQQHYQAGRYDSALTVSNALIEAFPEKAETYYNRAACLLQAGRYAEAILDFKESATLNTNLHQALLLTAYCYEKAGDLQHAMELYCQLPAGENTNNSGQRIKLYHLSVWISTQWYYMLLLLLLLILLIATTGSLLGSKR